MEGVAGPTRGVLRVVRVSGVGAGRGMAGGAAAVVGVGAGYVLVTLDIFVQCVRVVVVPRNIHSINRIVL